MMTPIQNYQSVPIKKIRPIYNINVQPLNSEAQTASRGRSWLKEINLVEQYAD